MEREEGNVENNDSNRSNVTLYHDFDVVAVTNAWIRHQKTSTRLGCVVSRMVAQIIFNSLETILLLSLVIVLLLEGEENIPEFIAIFLMWLFTEALTVNVKTLFQRNLNKPENYWSIQVGGFFQAMFRILKPVKYMRIWQHRSTKLTMLGTDFNDGTTVTRENVELVNKVNREELIDARDDLHDAFLQRIPMAVLQFYFLSYPNIPTVTNILINFLRIMIILTNLVAAVQSCVVYDWVRRFYMNSVHVQGYLKMNGNYSVPRWEEGGILRFFYIVGIGASILSRFLLVSYAVRISWGHGFFCCLILFLLNWLFITMFPSMLTSAENLPLGIPIKIATVITRWVNAFAGIGTRFNDFTRHPVECGSYRVRLPLILSQVLNFALTFLLLFFYVQFMSTAIQGHEAMENEHSIDNGTDISHNHTNSVVTAVNNCNVTEGKAYGVANGFVSSTLDFLRLICDDPRSNFSRMNRLHWLFFYVHVVCSLAGNYYSYRSKNMGSVDDYFPPLITLLLCKQIFGKIFEIQDSSKKTSLVARFLFLLALDLKQFNNHFLSYNGMDDEDEINSTQWWDSKIGYLVDKLDPCRARYRSPVDPMPDLTTLPIEEEMYESYAIIQHLPYSRRLYIMCGRQIENSLDREITSRRLEATIEMLEMSKKEILSILDNIIMTGD